MQTSSPVDGDIALVPRQSSSSLCDGRRTRRGVNEGEVSSSSWAEQSQRDTRRPTNPCFPPPILSSTRTVRRTPGSHLPRCLAIEEPRKGRADVSSVSSFPSRRSSRQRKKTGLTLSLLPCEHLHVVRGDPGEELDVLVRVELGHLAFGCRFRSLQTTDKGEGRRSASAWTKIGGAVIDGLTKISIFL